MKLHEVWLPVWNLPLWVPVATAASLWASVSLPIGISLPASSLHSVLSQGPAGWFFQSLKPGRLPWLFLTPSAVSDHDKRTRCSLPAPSYCVSD